MLKHEIPTPAVLVDLDTLRRNIDHMAQRARQAEVKLRPHIKTHKIPEIAQMQQEAGAIGVTCAKVSEAKVMLEAGIKDILIAYPTVGDYQLTEALKLAKRCRLILALDSFYGARKISEVARRENQVVECYMIINTGGNRDGVLPGKEALELARQLKGLPNIKLIGLMTHEGHVYKGTEQTVKSLATKAWEEMTNTKHLLEGAGLPLSEVSIGSTPTCWKGDSAGAITEWRPGTYVFNDAQEFLLATSQQDCALTVLTTVVSKPTAERAVFDAGSKTLTLSFHDEIGYGYIKQAPEDRIVGLSEEHAVVRTGGSRLEIGQRVEIIPVHVCPVVNLTDQVYVIQNNKVVNVWQVAARGQVI